MKKIIYFLLMLVCLLSACAPAETHKFTEIDKGGYTENVPVYYADEFLFKNGDNPPISIVVIDSCEYMLVYIYDGSKYLVHKGNCKYCAERRKKELDDFYEKLTNKNNVKFDF